MNILGVANLAYFPHPVIFTTTKPEFTLSRLFLKYINISHSHAMQGLSSTDIDLLVLAGDSDLDMADAHETVVKPEQGEQIASDQDGEASARSEGKVTTKMEDNEKKV